MTNEPQRPDPDALLNRIKAEEKQAKRGKLKIFFGSSAGVGKTYAMLSASHEALREGINVAVGVVETHKRPETEKLLDGLTLIPPLATNYKGVELKELNLDEALKRKPQILLIDELAHTNAPGSRHPKRWLDVMELLDAGIDVYTTLNVQHIESLADIVAGATGVWVKETVPDSIFDEADDIQLVDIDADDLLKRLQEGKVYIAEQVKARAKESFFKKNNLIALREMALRRTAERVDAQMNAYYDTAGKTEKLALSERILVCFGPGPTSAKLIRTTKRLANAMKAPWFALCIEASSRDPFDESERRTVESLSRMVERIGGKPVILQGDSIADDVIAFARQHNFSKIIVGKSVRAPWRNLFRLSTADQIIHKSGSIDVYVVTGDDSDGQRQKIEPPPSSFLHALPRYALAFLVLLLTTLIGVALRDYIKPTDQALLYVTSILLVAINLGKGPAFFFTPFAAYCFNFFFIPPFYSFGIHHRSYFITFLAMLATGFFTANQASRLRLQMLAARKKEKETQSFFRLTRELTSTRGRKHVSDVVVRYANDILDVNATVWMPGNEGQPPTAIVGALPEEGYMKELGVLQWCYDNSQIAGRQTNTMPSAIGLYFPLVSSSGTIGTLGVFPKDEKRVFAPDEFSTLEMIASLLATALERVRMGEASEQARVKEESEKLRLELERARVAILEAQKGNIAPCLEIYKPIVQ